MFKIVLGNRFKSSTRNANYISMQDYMQAHSEMSGIIFIPGQGVNARERSYILSNNSHPISRDLAPSVLQLCHTKVHKSKQQNVVISQLAPVADNKEQTYSANLVVDNDNEFILDHVSGYHIPGIIFIEAIRQLAMASWALLEGQPAETKAMIMKDIQASYQGLAHPLPTRIIARLEPSSDGAYLISCEFTQNKRVVVRISGSFKVSGKDKLQRLEALLPKKHTTMQLNELQAQLERLSIRERSCA